MRELCNRLRYARHPDSTVPEVTTLTHLKNPGGFFYRMSLDVGLSDVSSWLDSSCIVRQEPQTWCWVLLEASFQEASDAFLSPSLGTRKSHVQVFLERDQGMGCPKKELAKSAWAGGFVGRGCVGCDVLVHVEGQSPVHFSHSPLCFSALLPSHFPAGFQWVSATLSASGRLRRLEGGRIRQMTVIMPETLLVASAGGWGSSSHGGRPLVGIVQT